ncbi:MAG TPA: amidohydrolase family protein [Chloroflexota bacterium]|nr:amidohydrolase family protein [Chloroflexota bacterium]
MDADMRLVLDNASVLDVPGGRLVPNQRVVVHARRIEQVEPAQARLADGTPGEVVDVRGKTVMPGLCDAHVHVTAWTANLSEMMRSSPFYTAARAAEILHGMLMRGFTTVRDEGGADYGLALAVNEGRLTGPRILFCGRTLSQTGGHGDWRGRGETVVHSLGENVGITHLCDGVPQVRHAAREEIRKGAHHIKLMLSGGVASPTDRLTNSQFAPEEIRAAVEEAENAGLYCTGHAYTTRAVNTALDCGVRSLEHCNLIDQTSVERFVQHDAFMVPTLVTYEALAREGVEAGLPAALRDKVFEVLDHGLRALDLAYRGGVKLAYGTDLLGAMHKDQLQEFDLRSEVQPPLEVIRGATTIAADLFNERGQTGIVAAGARADLLVVDGNPLEDLRCLQDPQRFLKAILKDGAFYKNEL